MFRCDQIQSHALRLSLEEFSKQEVPASFIAQALAAIRTTCWSSDGNNFTLNPDFATDPRIRGLFSSILDLERKEKVAHDAGFGSIKELVEAHLVHHLWNHVDARVEREDAYVPLGCLLQSANPKHLSAPKIPLKSDCSASSKRRREERFDASDEMGESPSQSGKEQQQHDETLETDWTYLQERVDGWFKERMGTMPPEDQLKMEGLDEFEFPKESELSSEEEPLRKKMRLLPPEEEIERSELDSSKALELGTLMRNWQSFKERVIAHPPLVLFDKENEAHRKEQFEQFGIRFVTAFARMNAQGKGEYPFTITTDFIDVCYQGWDVEIRALERMSRDEPSFLDPVLEAWKVVRTVRRGLVTQVLSETFGEKFMNNRHYQSAMEHAMNEFFWLGYTKEELAKPESELILLCKQSGFDPFTKLLDEQAPSTVIQILKGKYENMSEEERKALFEEVLECYQKDACHDASLLIDQMEEVKVLMEDLMVASGWDRIKEIYCLLLDFEVQPPTLAFLKEDRAQNPFMIEQAQAFSATFPQLRLKRNRFLLEKRLLEDEVFGSYAWAALAKVIRLDTTEHHPWLHTRILKWIEELPLLPKQTEAILVAAAHKLQTLAPGQWHDQVRTAIQNRDVDALARLALNPPAVRESLKEIMIMGSLQEALQWLEEYPSETFLENELVKFIAIAAARGWLPLLEKLKEDPRVAFWAWGGILYSWEKNGQSNLVDERLAQEGGELVLRNAIQISATDMNPFRVLSKLLQRAGIETGPETLSRAIYQAEKKQYLNVGYALNQEGHGNKIPGALMIAWEEEDDETFLRLLNLDNIPSARAGMALYELARRNYQTIAGIYFHYHLTDKAKDLGEAIGWAVHFNDPLALRMLITLGNGEVQMENIFGAITLALTKEGGILLMEEFASVSDYKILCMARGAIQYLHLKNKSSLKPLHSSENSDIWAQTILFMIKEERSDLILQIPSDVICSEALDIAVAFASEQKDLLSLEQLMTLAKCNKDKLKIKGVILYHKLQSSLTAAAVKIPQSLLETALLEAIRLKKRGVIGPAFGHLFRQLSASTDSPDFRRLCGKLIEAASLGENHVILMEFSTIKDYVVECQAKAVTLYLQMKENKSDLLLPDRVNGQVILHQAILFAVKCEDSHTTAGLLEQRQLVGFGSSDLLAYLSYAIEMRWISSTNISQVRILGNIFYWEDKMRGGVEWNISNKKLSGEVLGRALYLAVLEENVSKVELFLSKGLIAGIDFLAAIQAAISKGSLAVLEVLNRSARQKQSVDVLGGVVYWSLARGDGERAQKVLGGDGLCFKTLSKKNKYLQDIASKGLQLAAQFNDVAVMNSLLQKTLFDTENLAFAFYCAEQNGAAATVSTLAMRPDAQEIVNRAILLAVKEKNIQLCFRLVSKNSEVRLYSHVISELLCLAAVENQPLLVKVFRKLGLIKREECVEAMKLAIIKGEVVRFRNLMNMIPTLTITDYAVLLRRAISHLPLITEEIYKKSSRSVIISEAISQEIDEIEESDVYLINSTLIRLLQANGYSESDLNRILRINLSPDEREKFFESFAIMATLLLPFGQLIFLQKFIEVGALSSKTVDALIERAKSENKESSMQLLFSKIEPELAEI